MSLLDVIDDNVILAHVDVVVVDETIALLMYDVHAVDVLDDDDDDDVVVDLIPLDEVVHEGIGVDEVGEDVSPLVVMRPAGSIS